MIRSDRLPIAAALVAAFSLSAFDACATTPAVTNCNDSGTGSLRASVTGATSGSVINLSSLQCSPITLTSGAIVVAQDDLLIYGPGSDKLTIQGEQATGSGAVFDHFGGGLLELDHMTIATGSVYSNDANKYFGGGCIASLNGSVTLYDATVDSCNANVGTAATSRGGAIFAAGNVTLNRSVVSNSSAIPYGSYYYCPDGYCYYGFRSATPRVVTIPSRGGAIFAKGNVTIDHSTLHGASASYGGGIYAGGQVRVYYSTISATTGRGGGIMTNGTQSVTVSNSLFVDFRGGAVYAKPATGGSPRLRIVNSTIADGFGAPIVSSAMPTYIYNSTLAFNTDRGLGPSGGYYYYQTTTVRVTNAPLILVSSIIGANYGSDVVLVGTSTVSGSHNLVTTANAALPNDTKVACPQLDALADNGGPTWTLATLSTSQAIGAGANPLALADDQRGPGFARQSGGHADIGAFQWDEAPIFRASFDRKTGCGPPPF